METQRNDAAADQIKAEADLVTAREAFETTMAANLEAIEGA